MVKMELAVFINGNMSNLIRELGVKVDSGERLGISCKEIFKKPFLGIREICQIFLGSVGTQNPHFCFSLPSKLRCLILR